MPGRAYVMKEMKGIVEYIVDNSLYGEVRGRKMWIDFADTQLTDRTWQSLKETFLKRILPDIHNPYYKLTMDQIRSFRMGEDVAKNTAKLEIRTATESANEEPQPSTSKINDSNKATGENDKTCLKISSNRDSLETVVLATEEFYENAEELIKELESDADAENDEDTQPRRSLRDCITYSEPLTPLLQDIIHDFDSEDSDGDHPMVIDQNACNDDTRNKNADFKDNLNNSENDEQPQAESNKIQDNGNKEINNHQAPENSNKKSLLLRKNKKVEKKVSKRKINGTSNEVNQDSGGLTHEKEKSKPARLQQKRTSRNSVQISTAQNSSVEHINELTPSEAIAKTISEPQGSLPGHPSQNVSNSITDSVLPNNQEALQANEKEVIIVEDSLPDATKNQNNLKTPEVGIKRTSSTDLDNECKVIKSGDNKTMNSETQMEKQTNAVVESNQDNQSSEHNSNDNIFDGIKNPRKIIGNKENNEKQDFVKQSADSGQKEISTESNKDAESIPSSNPCLQSVSLFEECLAAEDSDELLSSRSEEKTDAQKQTLVSNVNNKVDKIITKIAIESKKTVTGAPTKKSNEQVHRNALKLRKTKENGEETWGVVLENPPKEVFDKEKEVVVLRSHSSDSEEIQPRRVEENKRNSIYKHKNKVVDHLFGNFGAGLGKRKRKNSYQNTTRHQIVQQRKLYDDSMEIYSDSYDSEWTSESDSEYVSPPPRPHHRRSRNDLRSQTYKIRRQKGMLFVAVGDQMWPIFKDGERLTSLLANQNEENNESYWKLKYVEEKKRNAELKRLMEIPRVENNDLNQKPSNQDYSSPILPCTSYKKQTETRHNGDHLSSDSVKDKEGVRLSEAQQSLKKHEPVTTSQQAKESVSGGPLKIKIARDSVEVQLEGNMQNIQPMLSDILKMLNERPKAEIKKEKRPSIPTIELKSGSATPVNPDEDVRKRVDALEEEIYEETKRLEMLEEEEPDREKQSSGDKNIKSLPTEPEPLSRKPQTDFGETATPSSKRKTVEKQHMTEVEKSKTPTDFKEAASPSSKTKAVEKRGITEVEKSKTTDFGETATPASKPKALKNRRMTEVEKSKTPTVFEQIATSSSELKALKKRRMTEVEKSKTPTDFEEIATPSSKPKTLKKRRMTEVEKSETPTISSQAKKSSKLIESETVVNEDTSVSPRTPSKRRRQPKRVLENATAQVSKTDEEDDSETLYKFPSPEPEIQGKSKSKITMPKRKIASTSMEQEIKARGRPKSRLGKKLNNSKYNRRPTILRKPKIMPLSNESSQGYLDSDLSPAAILIRKKKRFTLPITKAHKRRTRSLMTKETKYFYWDASGESSNSSFRSLPARNVTIRNSSQNTEDYRSESYQLLMQPRINLRRLEMIGETSPCPNEIDSAGELRLSPASQNIMANQSESNSINIEMGHSSSVSLPMSPELSMVENISINTEILHASEYVSTINEIQEFAETEKEKEFSCNNNYVISNLDLSVPLMSQPCNLETYQKEIADSNQSIENNMSDSARNTTVEKGVTVSESFLDKIDTVNIKNQTLSESLDVRLSNLLLESAKKTALTNKETEERMEHDGKDTSKLTEIQKKTRSKKRCSTPQKRKVIKKSLPPKIDAVIEEEQMEFCMSGRKSCPPVISVFSAEDPDKPYESIEDLNVTEKKAPNKKKGKSIKDIIKVKITRPKKTPTKKSNKKSSNKMSILSDSGINDTISTGKLQSCNESVDLIHNHSETCLHANECLSNSVELVNKSISLISVNTSTESVRDNENKSGNMRSTLSPEFFSNDAQDGSDISRESDHTPKTSNGEVPRSPVVHYIAPRASLSSLLTDDLSEESPKTRPSTWQLFSEDETSNTLDPAACAMTNKYLSNLKQLFPIACAVPDLSTITERSRETDANSKSTVYTNMDSNTEKALLKEFGDNESSAFPNH